MRIVAYVLPSGKSWTRLAKGQRRESVSTFFSRVLEARRGRHDVRSLSGILVSLILPWTRRPKSPWARSAYSPV